MSNGAALEIRLVDANPAEQKAMDRGWDEVNNQPNQTPDSLVGTSPILQQVISATELVEELRKLIPQTITVAESSKQLQEDAGGDGKASDTTEEIREGKKDKTKPSESSTPKKNVESFKDLRNEIGTLLGRYLPEAISKPLMTLVDRIVGSINRFVPPALRERVESSLFSGSVSRPAASPTITGPVPLIAATAKPIITGPVPPVQAAGAAGAEAAGAGVLGTGIAALGGPVGIAVVAIGALAASSGKVQKSFEMLGEVVDFAVAPIQTIAEKFTNALNNAADELEAYSGAVAAARAQRDITSEMNKFDRANRIGAGLGQYEAATARFQDASERLLTSILEHLVRFVPIVEVVADTATAGVEGVNLLIQVVEQGIANIPGIGWQAGLDPTKEAKDVEAALERFANAAREIFRNTPGSDNDLNRWFNDFLAQQASQPLVRPRGVPRQIP